MVLGQVADHRALPSMGARRLVMSHSPRLWDAMMLGIGIDQENGEAIKRCRDRADRKNEAVRCTVSIAPREP